MNRDEPPLAPACSSANGTDQIDTTQGSGVAQLEHTLGTALIVAAALMLLTGLLLGVGADKTSLQSRTEAVGASASPEDTPMRSGTVKVVVGLILLGMLCLLREEPIVRDIKVWWSSPARAAPAWTLYDCLKVLAFLFVVSNLIALGFTSWIGRSAETLLSVDFAVKALTLGYVYFILKARTIGFAFLGLRSHRFVQAAWLALRAYFACIPGYVVCAIANVLIILWVCRLLGIDESVLNMQASLQYLQDPNAPPGMRLVLAGFAAVGAPITEEIFFRGLLYGALRRYLPWQVSALATGLLFGAVHGVLFMLPLAAFGVYLAILRERTGGVLVPILVHGLFNVVMMGLVFHNLIGG